MAGNAGAPARKVEPMLNAGEGARVPSSRSPTKQNLKRPTARMKRSLTMLTLLTRELLTRLLIKLILSKMKRLGFMLALFGLLIVTLLGSCSRKQPKPYIDDAAYAKEIAQWQTQRLTELKSEGGWLTLVGLFWLKEGDNKLGSDASNDMVLPPGKLGAQR